MLVRRGAKIRAEPRGDTAPLGTAEMERDVLADRRRLREVIRIPSGSSGWTDTRDVVGVPRVLTLGMDPDRPFVPRRSVTGVGID